MNISPFHPIVTYPIWRIASLLALWFIAIAALPLCAQTEMSRQDRIAALEMLQREDAEHEALMEQLRQTQPADIEKLQIPPLSVFLDAISQNAAVRRAQSEVDEMRNEYRLQRRDWWNYLRLQSMYSYGRFNVLSNASDEWTPMYQTSMASAQHNFNVGANVSVSLGELVNRKLKLKKYKYDINQLELSKEEVIEERRLRVLEAYNTVTMQLATISAKAETAALYNAQMKITEYNFIQGKIDITTLGLERGRRTGAVTAYEESRVALHNSILLLEMLTNVKIIKDK